MPDVKLTWRELARLARTHFGISRFRPGQRELIEAVLTGRDAIGVMPTGAGKSLTFQLPSLVASAPVLVVSPLIALMKDQHDQLAERGLRAAKLNSSVRASEQAEISAEIERGEHRLIYLTPERLEDPAQIDLLKERALSLLVVDEAHCIAQWGHDFRPAYLGVRDALRELGRPPVLALTATATQEVLEDIQRQLDMREPLIVQTGIDRPNLFVGVLRTPSEQIKRDRLLTLLREQPKPHLIYCATIRVARELHRWLEPHEWKVGLYHGQLSARDRDEVQQRFMDDELDVMVATNAFGMGVNKPNIRSVTHYNFPDSLETYWQEVGRAGRDGEPARASLLYRLEDKRVQSYFLGGKYPKRDDTLRVLAAVGGLEQGVRFAELAQLSGISERHCKVIAAQLEAAGLAERRRGSVRLLRSPEGGEELAAVLDAYETRRAQDRERLDAIMRYAQSPQCRRRLLHEYFDEPLAADCAHCDNCVAHAQGRAAAGLNIPLERPD
ncbi:MAG TPA: ATP-dependent DNA helicase RecQ [Polyangiales bacterium]|nr:ATP-dependent DNA helicase RecQ [Polyangiales bacterium]